MQAAVSIAALIAVGLTSACGGSPNTPNGSYVGSPGNPGDPPTRLVDVKVTVTVPSRTRGAKPNYVSPNTESLAIQLASVNGKAVSGVNPTIVNTVPKAHDCKAGAHGIICTATAEGSPGSDVFVATAYAGTGASGAVLSAGTVKATIGSGGGSVGVSNGLALTLDGVIAALDLKLSPTNAKRGTRTTVAVTLDAYDASGAEIIGPSDYSEPVSVVVEGDSSHSFRLHDANGSGESLTIRKPTGDITLTYDGNEQASPITVSASVAGSSSIGASAPFALLGKEPPPPVGTIYALNFGSSSGAAATVTAYDGKAKGNATPERTLLLDRKLFAVSIAVDSNGNLYVGYFDSANGASFGKPDSGNEIAIYAPGASGNDEPTAVLTQDTKTSTTIYPIFMTFDPSGRLVTYGATAADGNTGNAVLTYAAGSTGPAAPEYAFAFSSPAIYYPGPTGLTTDSANNFYLNGTFKSGFGSAYGMYVAAAADIGNPAANPARTIPWDSKTKLAAGFTSDVALNASAEIFIANNVKTGSGSSATCQAASNVYSAGAGGGVTDDPPLRIATLDGIQTKGTDCTNTFSPLLFYFPEIQIYAGSALFAADPFNDAVAEYPADAKGSAKPLLRIAGSATQLDAPIALVITSDSGLAEAGPVNGARAPERIPLKHQPLHEGRST
ncbi:MAG: hypothetical protein WAK11_05640 [Candidatus Cybelea sp.]